MESQHLQELESEFARAQEARAKAKNAIRLLEKELLPRYQAELSDTEVVIRQKQRAHDQADRLVESARIAGLRDKSQRRVARRNVHGEEAKAAREKRDGLLTAIHLLKVQITWLKVEFDIPSRNARYFALRHQLLVALQEVERDDPVAQKQKRDYIRYAKLPRSIVPDDVLVYAEHDRRVVHLFYGGKQSFDGPGISPDGQGHGHVVLVVGNWDPYYPKFKRLPE